MPASAHPSTHKPHRVLRYINIAIALLLVLLAVTVYWIAYRPLPQTSGTITAPVSQRVTIARDALGVPHISATSEDDAYFAQGYATAQDRLFQMDGLRRLAAGDLSEIIGPATLDTDRNSRILRMRRIAEDAYTSLPPQDRAPLAAYARGVNAFIQTHLHSLPLEFTLLGYQPRPWSVVDSILVGLHMYRTLTTTWKDEVLKRDMITTGDRAKVEFLFPPRSGAEWQPGSNAWAIGGSHTATGKPLLANDMHLEYSIPGIWYMVHLRAPGLNASGVSLPGTPSVIVGHNERIAWGVTNLHFDVQDLYVENFDERTGRYLYKGQVEQARQERELIPVKGAPTVEMPIWVTRHGPLVINSAKEHLALRWAAAEPRAFQFPFPQLNKAANWQEFTTALARFPGPGQNFVYADVDGNIGYHATGLLPIRKSYVGDLPVDGSSGDYEWQGFIPFDQLPAFYNPPSGLIVTANQNPFPQDYPYTVNGNFSSHYRSRQIRDLLSARNGWRAPDLLGVQKDVYSAFLRYFAGSLISAYDKNKARHSELDTVVGQLRGWSGQMEKDQAAPMIATVAYDRFRLAVAQRASPKLGAVYDYQMAPAVIEKLLRTRPAGWFDNWDETLLRSLTEGLEDGRRSQGRDTGRWNYGNYRELLIANPVGRELQRRLSPLAALLRNVFDIGPVPMSGSPTTVKQLTGNLGPSMRLDADLSNWDHSLLEGTTGQSGEVLSKHYKDQWVRYYGAQSFPMQFSHVDVKETLTLAP
ncbi:MAG: penicillin acylase family protein [Bryobacteraceae bacterium]